VVGLAQARWTFQVLQGSKL